jgi:hypothetical protein
MPKRAISVNDIQLVENIVEASAPSEEWTAQQYPSAKTLYNIYNKMYPICSVVCMSTNKNPGGADALGIGTWTLVKRELKDTYVSLAEGKGWTSTNATLETGCFMVHNDMWNVYLNVKLTKATADSTTALGTLDPTVIGLTRVPFEKNGLPFTIDGDSVTGNYRVETSNVVSINDAWTPDGTHAFTYGSYPLCLHFSYTIPQENYLMDSFCDKFYFKRTA